MKRTLILLATISLCLTLTGCQQQEITLTNLTGVDILELRMRRTGTMEWSHDLMADVDVFASDESGVFVLKVSDPNSMWDIMFIDSDGDEIIFTGLSLASATLLEFTWGFDGGTPSIVMTRSDGAQFYAEGETADDRSRLPATVIRG